MFIIELYSLYGTQWAMASTMSRTPPVISLVPRRRNDSLRAIGACPWEVIHRVCIYNYIYMCVCVYMIFFAVAHCCICSGSARFGEFEKLWNEKLTPGIILANGVSERWRLHGSAQLDQCFGGWRQIVRSLTAGKSGTNCRRNGPAESRRILF